ncbi:amino acid adenylation domain-containing protein [Paenibacillus thiaminolyticus]|uniref:amino acid adenylation domain-containing protein n=1 Tax=Paenibacillus thiaminolyticus TaxID=49283 RepID=UPI0035A6FA37
MEFEWNVTAVSYERDVALHQLFERQAALTPARKALSYEGLDITYGDLNQRANRLAHRLRQEGVGAGVYVGVYMERSMEMVVSLLAILKAGGAYVPIDPAYPAERLAYLVEDAELTALIVQARLIDSLPLLAAPVRMILADDEALGQGNTESLDIAVEEESPAYLIYTSGSTGRPKGVVVPHQAIVNHMRWMLNEFPLDADDAVLQKTSFSFDASIWEFYAPLLSGARLVLARPEAQADPEYLIDVIRRERITTLQVVPTLLAMLLEDPSFDQCASLKRVLCGGEALTVQLRDRFMSRSRAALINLYGPTEACIDATFWECDPKNDGQVVPIGRPIANMRAYIVDEQLRQVPVGEPGELLLGGAGLALGYHKRLNLTAEKFITDPFVGDSDSRLYRTGDRARWLPNGAIEYLGRLDHQVKIRGFRIELHEIEAVLREHPSVRQALAAVQDRPDGQRLIAYVIAGNVNGKELQNYCDTKLPHYMIPAAIVMLNQFPVLPNGKVDRNQLPEPDYSQDPGDHPLPHTPVQRQLAAIWEEVLARHSVGLEENFFMAGGHSLTAMQVLFRIRTQFQASITLSEMFAAPTLAQLASLIEQKSAVACIDNGIRKVERNSVCRASHAQEQMYLLDHLEGGHPAYNVYKAFHITGPLDVRKLREGFEAVISRHESLRTVFRMEGEQLMQVPVTEPEFMLAVEHLYDVPPAQRNQEAMRRISKEAAATFDLERGPLLRALLLQVNEDEYWLLIAMHHIISDGWSLQVLVQELSAHYRHQGEISGTSSVLPTLTVQVADVSQWQRERLAGESERLIAYWKQRLAGIPALLDLPTDAPRPQGMSFFGDIIPIELSPALARKLTELGKAEQATPYMVLLASFQALLHRYTHQEDIVVGSPVACRERPELEGLIGYFINTLPLRGDFSAMDLSFCQFLRQVRETVLEALEHQALPIETIVDVLQVERSLSYNPIFQAMFNMQNISDATQHFTDVCMEDVDLHNGTSKFDLSLNVEQTTDGGFKGYFEYNTELYAAGMIRQMAAHFLALLERVTEEPDAQVGLIPLLSDKECSRQIISYNDTARSYERGVTLQELFERQAAGSPERTALRFEGQSMSYGEMNKLANRMARRLHRSGAGAEVRVGVCMERSLEMIVSLYAILKAGGAYVPVDPSYPEERIAFMMEDAQVDVLLTQSHLIGLLPNMEAKVLAVDQESFEGECDENLGRIANEDNLAYLIYTSGSTGTPKGVMIPHKGIVNRLLWMQEEYQLTERDVVLQKTPFSFDVSVWEIFWPLLIGATMVIAAPDGHKDPAYLAELIRTEGISTLHFVPSMLQVFLEEDSVGSCTSIRQVMCSGEALPYLLQERFFEKMGFAALHNLYGPTEASVDVTYWKCQQGSARQSVPIGKPIANTQMYIVDRYMQPVPVGVAGELLIGGIGLARGYHNRPDLTAEKFIADPFSSDPQAQLYRTGDLGRYLPDGTIEYLGRLDHQVKVRGFRIELGEIETALAAHQAVREAVVMAAEDQPGEKQLIAYLTLKNGSPQPTVRELQQFMRTKLPEYMTPSFFVILEQFPLTPNGKVDRKALKKAGGSIRCSERTEMVVPRNEKETQMSEIWKQVLRMEQLCVHDNFFEIGGDSILAIQIISRANRAGWRLKPKDLFKYQTVAQLVQAGEAVQTEIACPTWQEADVRLTPIQHWFFQQEQPDAHHWNLPLLVEVTKGTDPGLLRQAIEATALCHDAFRLRYEQGESGVEQRYASDPAGDVFEEMDLSDVPESEQRAALEAHAASLQSTLELAKGPLFKAAYYNYGKHRTGRLFLLLHHLIADGITWRILLEDIEAAYGQLQHGQAVTWPPPSASLQQWSRRLTEYAQSEFIRKELPYWTQSARDRVASLPIELADGMNLESSADEVVVVLDPSHTRQLLQESSRAYRTQAPDLLLTALFQAMHHWTGEDALLVDLEGHGREDLFDDLELTRTIGWFTTLYPVLLQGDGQMRTGELIKSIKEQLRAVPNNGIGYGMLRYLSTDEVVKRTIAAIPQADVLFNYLGQLDAIYSSTSLFAHAKEGTGPYRSLNGKRIHLLEIYGGVENGSLVMRFVYSRDLHLRATIEQLGTDFLSRLQDLISHCLSPDAGGCTPSDFKGARLSQGQLDKFLTILEAGAKKN